MDWNDYKFVLAVGRCEGLGAAARELSISHSTAHRMLERIEKSLGVKLFERSGGGYRLTTEGRIIATVAETMESSILAAERRVVGTDKKLRGTIRVNTSELVGLYLFPEMLSRFVDQYPDVTVITSISNSLSDLSQSDADITIRATSKPPLNMIGRKVALIPYCAYAHKSLVTRNPKRPLNSYDWIVHDNGDPQSVLARWIRTIGVVKESRILFDCNAGVREAVARGLGAAVLPCFTGDQMPEVVRIGEVQIEPNYHLWMLTHTDMRGNARVSAFMKFIAGLLESSPYMAEARLAAARNP